MLIVSAVILTGLVVAQIAARVALQNAEGLRDLPRRLQDA